MATYLQGVQDYIPQLQPFQPDLNLYANVLQTKQTQYDTAWKSLNNIYGQYFYADLTRDSNIERKEEIVKNIEFNMKRIAGLDLSLTQNVEQATQVFRPFYEDKYLMKDMAWTKNYSNQRGRAEGYKNSLKEDQRGMYWDGGVRALDYMREEFKDASDEDSLGFGNAEYTPYVNSIKLAQKLAKDSGLSMETVKFSPDNRWVVTTKNGQQLMEPLSRLFEAELGKDPAVQAVYKTQAYLDRKDYAAANAAQFNGDKNAAEMKYLQDNFNILKQEQMKRYKMLEQENTVYDNKIKDVENRLKRVKSADLENYLEQLKQAKQTNQTVLDRVQSDNDALADADGTTNTSTGAQNPYGDIKSLRWKVDNARASTLMEKDFNEAAYIFSMRDAKQSMEANPYAVNEQKHQFAMQEVALRNQGLANAAKIRNAGEMEKLRMQAALDAGIAAINPKTAQIEMVESYDNIYTTADYDGNTTGQGESYAKVNRQLEDRMTTDFAAPYMQQSLALLDRSVTQGLLSNADAEKILGMSLAKAKEQFNANPTAFVTRTMGSKGMSTLKTGMDNFVSKNNKQSVIADGIAAYGQASSKFNGYTQYQASVENWRKTSAQEVAQRLEGQGFEDADLLFDKNGHMRGYEEYNANVAARYDNNLIKFKGPYSDTKVETVTYDEYAEMWRAANEVYSGKMNTTPPPGISSYGQGGGGIASTGFQNVSVSNKAPGMLGYQYYKEFEREMRNTNFSAFTNTGSRLSINGTAEYGFNNYDNVKLPFLLDHITSKMSDTKKKFNFDLASSAIAANKSDVGAMVIKITPDMLEGLVATDKENTNGMFTRDEAQKMYQNGLTVFKDGGWNNGLYKSSYMDPISAIIEYEGSYRECDPYGNAEINIEKDDLHMGDYKVETIYNILDVNSGETIESKDIKRGQNMGRNFAQPLDDWRNTYEFVNNHNNGLYNY
jgi:hypothetical protein